MNQLFHECSCKLQEALREVEKIDFITKDPSIYINQHFDEFKDQITCRRESLIEDINDYSDQLIQENESNKSQCLQISAKTEALVIIIDFLKEQIFDLKKQFETFDKSVAQLRFEETKFEVNCLKKRLSKTLKDYRESLLLNREHSFVCFYQPIEDIVGKMLDKNQIVTTDEGQFQEENLEEIIEYDETLSESDSPLAQLNNEPTDVQCQDQILDQVHEYEETGGRFKINGYYYNFTNESKTKNNYYRCYKRNSQKCRGSITISPNRQIIKRVEHSCQSQNQILEEVHEYEEIGRGFKINGYYYTFQREFKSKNQYYMCNKRKGQKCRGSITLSPNQHIVKKVDHTCKLLPS